MYIDASKIEVNQVDPERVEYTLTNCVYCKTKHLYEHPIHSPTENDKMALKCIHH